jgi:glycosyltransferase involved in cell wall biosynthesis
MRFLFFANRPDISFGKQAQILINALRNMGHEVLDVDHGVHPKVKLKAYESFQPDVIVVWTFFHDIGHPTMAISEMPKPRKYFLIGFEVSDTTRLSDKAISMVNELAPDVLVTPSTWSARGFHDTSVPIVVIPHAIDPQLFEAVKNYSKLYYPSLDYSLPRVFVYANHSFSRKGWDIALSVLQEVCGSRANFNVMLKTWQYFDRSVYDIACRKLLLSGHVSSALHYASMNQATHFFYPVRGGAFEIPVLEMLALGKTVIIPEQGAWTDIPLSRDDVYWIKVSSFKRYWFDNPYHVGDFVEPDRDDAERKLLSALEGPLSIDVKKYHEAYSPQAIAEKFVELIKS